MAQSLTSSSPSECDELAGVGGQKRSAKDFNREIKIHVYGTRQTANVS